MKLSDDIQSARPLHGKGWLFLLIALMAAALLLAESPRMTTVLLCAPLAWAAARFYYYLFYVRERHVGRDRPYAGIPDELRRIRTRRK